MIHKMISILYIKGIHYFQIYSSIKLLYLQFYPFYFSIQIINKMNNTIRGFKLLIKKIS